MAVMRLLEELVVHPLMSIYEQVFRAILQIAPGPGSAILLFSVIVNLLMLPVYRQMESANRRAAQSRKPMEQEIARIRAHYRGRERYYYIRTIHRQSGYHPISVVFSFGDLLLQMIVFATVFRFLSSQRSFVGSEFLAIGDLGRPDGLLAGVNLLPLLMTLLNVLSVLRYTSDSRGRRNALLLAATFLVLLYRSPAALVLYWTSNNAISLLRTVAEREVAALAPARLRSFVGRVAAQE